MEPQNKDESRDRRREEALARRMGEALDGLSPRDAGECPDAELIAAYHERALQPDEIAQCEGHFATCVRCRKVLLVLAASTGTPLDQKEVARLGQLVAAARAPLEAASRSTEPNRSSWRARWLAPVLAKILPALAREAGKPLSKEEAARLAEMVAGARSPQEAASGTVEPMRPDRPDWRGRWLAPALGVAAVLAVWFAMRPPWRSGNQNPSGTLIAQAPRSEPPENTVSPALDQLSKVAPKKSAETDAVTAKEQTFNRAQSPNLTAEAPAKKAPAESDAIGAGGAVTPSVGAFGGVVGDKRKDEAELKSAPTGAPAPTPQRVLLPAPAAPPKTEAQDTERAQSSTGVPGSAAQSVVTEAAPADSGAAGAVSNAPAREKQKGAQQAAGDSTSGARTATSLSLESRDFKALSKLDALRENAFLAKTSSGSRLWRAGKGNNIERSTDAGITWIQQASPLQEDWLAGAAVSDTICWIVGRNGSIARTMDGEHWEKIAPPQLAADATGKLPDWVSVAASDSQAATITASNQRRYATQDGGKTWRSQ